MYIHVHVYMVSNINIGRDVNSKVLGERHNCPGSCILMFLHVHVCVSYNSIFIYNYYTYIYFILI